MPVGVLETGAPVAKVHLPGDASVHHPLQRAVGGRAANPVAGRAHDVDQFVSSEVALLLKEEVDDLIALAGAASARRTMTLDECFPRFHHAYP